MIQAREIRYQADEREMVATVALPDGPGPHPVVLIAHEGPGLDDVQRARASEIAALGYIGFALDYHGELSPFATRDHMMERLGVLSADPDRTRAIAHCALRAALTMPTADPTRVAAIGYCFGGTVALELGRSGADLKAIVGFHPGLTNKRPADNANITARVLLCIGSDDPLIPFDDRSRFEMEMRGTDVDWQIDVYGGALHSFTHPLASAAGIPGIGYHKIAATRAWESMRVLLADVF